MPLGFREENLNTRLRALETEYGPGNKERHPLERKHGPAMSSIQRVGSDDA